MVVNTGNNLYPSHLRYHVSVSRDSWSDICFVVLKKVDLLSLVKVFELLVYHVEVWPHVRHLCPALLHDLYITGRCCLLTDGRTA